MALQEILRLPTRLSPGAQPWAWPLPSLLFSVAAQSTRKDTLALHTGGRWTAKCSFLPLTVILWDPSGLQKGKVC